MAISSIEDFVPNTRAKIPKIDTKTFFHILQFHFPKPFSQNVIVSIITGNNNPKIEKQKAPINPMNGPIVGTATAITTANVTKIVLKT